MTTLIPQARTTPDELLGRLEWRYATKRFDPSVRIDPATWKVLEESLRLAPSSYGLQPWHFVVVTDRAKKEELRPASWNQPQITECSHLVVFTYRKGLSTADVARLVDRTAEVRGVPRESLAAYEQAMASHVQRPKPFDIDEWSRRQLYIALGTFLTSAAILGVDACPMEGVDPARYDAILELPARGLATVCVAAAGQRARDDKYASLAKVRFEARAVLTHFD
jgi:nitroreductase